MIKRSSGFFKIAFFVFCVFIGLFLILFSMTDIRNYVTTEIFVFAFCVSIVIIPLILEIILYSLGVLTKCIKVNSVTNSYSYTPMKKSNIPYAPLIDNGIEKMMFFSNEGKIITLTTNNTEIHWGSDKNEIQVKCKFGECYSFFKSIYGTKYENVECEVFTTLKNECETKEVLEPAESIEKEKQQEVSTPAEMNPAVVEKIEELPTEVTEQNNPPEHENEDKNKFEYSISDNDVLYETTVKI